MVIKRDKRDKEKCCESCAYMLLGNKSNKSPTKPKKLT